MRDGRWAMAMGDGEGARLSPRRRVETRQDDLCTLGSTGSVHLPVSVIFLRMCSWYFPLPCQQASPFPGLAATTPPTASRDPLADVGTCGKRELEGGAGPRCRPPQDQAPGHARSPESRPTASASSQFRRD